jgi:hypothetical protein
MQDTHNNLDRHCTVYGREGQRNWKIVSVVAGGQMVSYELQNINTGERIIRALDRLTSLY